MLPGVDSVSVFQLLSLLLFLFILIGIFWVSWRWSKRLKFRNLFFWWLGLSFLGASISGGARAAKTPDGLYQFSADCLSVLGLFYGLAMIFRGCRFLWGKISKKSSDS